MSKVRDARKAVVEPRSLSELNSFPRQQDFFPDLAEAPLKALGDDIKRRGLKRSIHVLPKNEAGFAVNTIIDGHQRCRALRLLGRDKCKVLVRYDLANASREKIEQEFLSDNLARRQLSKLGQARALLRFYEIERGKKGEQTSRARDRVGAIIGMSGKHIDRLWKILRTPAEVQAAFEAGQLPLQLAVRVSGLSDADQKTIAARISNGEATRRVVSEALGTASKSPNSDARLKLALRGLAQARRLRKFIGVKALVAHLPQIRDASEDLQFVVSKLTKRPPK